MHKILFLVIIFTCHSCTIHYSLVDEELEKQEYFELVINRNSSKFYHQKEIRSYQANLIRDKMNKNLYWVRDSINCMNITNIITIEGKTNFQTRSLQFRDSLDYFFIPDGFVLNAFENDSNIYHLETYHNMDYNMLTLPNKTDSISFGHSIAGNIGGLTLTEKDSIVLLRFENTALKFTQGGSCLCAESIEIISPKDDSTIVSINFFGKIKHFEFERMK